MPARRMRGEIDSWQGSLGPKLVLGLEDRMGDSGSSRRTEIAGIWDTGSIEEEGFRSMMNERL